MGRVVGGSNKYHIHAQHLPAGPQTAGAFARWPRDVIRALTDQRPHEAPEHVEARGRRLHDNLKLGIILHTDYSGKQAPETVFRILGLALSESGKFGYDIPGNADGPIPSSKRFDWLLCWRACDVDPFCREIIQKSKYPVQHLVPDITCRLPPALHQRVVQSRPKPNATLQEKLAAYEKMQAMLVKHKHCFQRGMPTPCLSHPGQLCPLAWQDDLGINTSLCPLDCEFCRDSLHTMVYRRKE